MHENVKDHIHTLHLKRVECEQEVSIHDICETHERPVLVTLLVNKQGSGHVAHALDVSQVGPQHGVGEQDVLERLVERVAPPELSQLPERPVQVLLYHFQVLLKSATVVQITHMLNLVQRTL